jgi:cell division protein FtsB
VIGRARTALLVAVIAGMVIIATEFPLGQLTRGRAAVADASQQLSLLQAQNRALSAEVTSLRQSSTVARIAHQEYGLVGKGERSIVVLPSSPPAGDSGTGPSAGPLTSTGVPKSDLVPSDAIVSPSAGTSHPDRTPGFWERVLQRLEFWRAIP